MSFPYNLKPGEFRIMLNLSALEDNAWSALNAVNEMGFTPLRFEVHKSEEGLQGFAILLQEFHEPNTTDYCQASRPWNDKIELLYEKIEEFGPINAVKVMGRLKSPKSNTKLDAD